MLWFEAGAGDEAGAGRSLELFAQRASLFLNRIPLLLNATELVVRDIMDSSCRLQINLCKSLQTAASQPSAFANRAST